MKELNKLWLALIAIGIITLIFSIAFNIFQTTTGESAKFEIKVNPITSSQLFNKKVEDHFLAGEEFSN